MNPSWTMEQWSALDAEVRATRTSRPDSCARASRRVLRSFSGSFFLVTRFLPAQKRAQVESIYAAVRYPDEIVDTFPLSTSEKYALLDRWEAQYERALLLGDAHSRFEEGLPWILASFADVVIGSRIPREHYRSFLEAMRRDIEPEPFRSLEDLIVRYVYGSAIVVGYFLAHVYGTSEGMALKDAYDSAANLGIALQLTNFCRDVDEDQRRGRLYIPSDLRQSRGLNGAIAQVAAEAERRYSQAEATVGVFAADTRPAIRACIDVYRLLNRRIIERGSVPGIRHSVPVTEKLRALPPDKYWRVPLAYLGVL
jgi:phytoene synthase